MNYQTAYYWHREETTVSLGLQHLIYRRESLPVLFACICTGDFGDYFAQQLTNWFRRKGRELCRKGKCRGMENVEKDLRIVLKRINAEIERNITLRKRVVFEKTAVSGFLGVENRFVIVNRGSNKFYLLNNRFERSNCSSLFNEEMGKDEFQLIQGEMEHGVGILMATEPFCRQISEQQLCECLTMKEITGKQSIRRHMKELGDENYRRGERDLGAIVIATC